MKKYGLCILGIGALFLMGCSDGKTQEIQSPAETPTAIVTNQDSPQYVTIKYRDSKVDVSNFEYIDLSNNSNVQKAWYDTKHEYMVINLKGVNYQYCLLPITVWSDLKTATDADKRFQSNIKGNYDCRKGGLPTYE